MAVSYSFAPLFYYYFFICLSGRPCLIGREPRERESERRNEKTNKRGRRMNKKTERAELSRTRAPESSATYVSDLLLYGPPKDLFQLFFADKKKNPCRPSDWPSSPTTTTCRSRCWNTTTDGKRIDDGTHPSAGCWRREPRQTRLGDDGSR